MLPSQICREKFFILIMNETKSKLTTMYSGYTRRLYCVCIKYAKIYIGVIAHGLNLEMFLSLKVGSSFCILGVHVAYDFL
jgi:hypothetical protein